MSLQQSWSKTLRIWIDRFGEAQRVIRQLEAENAVLAARIERAVDVMSDEQVIELWVRTVLAETAPAHVVGVSAEPQPSAGS